MKLSLADLRVVSFETAADSIDLPTLGPNDPTPQTHCDDCPAPTIFGCW